MKKTFFLGIIFTINTLMSQSIHYQLSIKSPNSHTAEVKMEIKEINTSEILIKMPVWTPGSYMIREFERNVISTNAKSGNQVLDCKKTDKNTWKVKIPKGIKSIEFNYTVYCFEATVRTSYIDNEHAFILPTSCLMFVDNMTNKKGTLKLDIPGAWHRVSTTLVKTAPYTYEFENYDDLADSPLEIGNHDELTFNVAGVPHTVALVGENNCNKEQFTKDLQKICETMTDIVGVHPCKSYLFIIHHVEEGGGGLEHANSNVVQFPRFNYTNDLKYKAFLGLCAHEYFHLWNVKRIRPIALGPFNYSQENYTNLLWVAEGITSYYDELALLRAGFWTEDDFLKATSKNISNTLNRIGGSVQSMHEASFDAWIKEYRTNENSLNTHISYYLKGSVIAALLDIQLIKASNGQKNLDDLMKFLYQEFYIKKQRGFTDEEFYNAINTVAGQAIDFKYWVELPNDNQSLEKIKAAFKSIDCELIVKENKKQDYTGLILEQKGDKTLVRSVESNSPALKSGLQAGDEIIGLNGWRVKNNFEELIKNCPVSTEVPVIISRNGLIQTLKISSSQDPKISLSIKVNSAANNQKWLSKKQ